MGTNLSEWGGTRTLGHRLKRPMLYHLSYPPIGPQGRFPATPSKKMSLENVARPLPPHDNYTLFSLFVKSASGRPLRFVSPPKKSVTHVVAQPVS